MPSMSLFIPNSLRPAARIVFYLLLWGSAFAIAAPPLQHAPSKQTNGKYTATAYSVSGKTASGEQTHRHVIAADPAILPIGSRIQVRRAGKYSGEYVVADTGEKIVGRKLDIYLPNTAECKRFGKKPVRVRVLEVGNGTPSPPSKRTKQLRKM